MKKIYLCTVLLVFLAWLLLPIPLPGQGGVYNPITELMWCSYYYGCLHEIGHKLDDDAGWISHTPEFSEAVYLFIGSELIAHDTNSQSYKLAHKIILQPGVISWSGRWLDSQSEIYATIFAFSDGKRENMPYIFREFYNWGEAEVLIDKHQKFDGR